MSSLMKITKNYSKTFQKSNGNSEISAFLKEQLSVMFPLLKADENPNN